MAAVAICTAGLVSAQGGEPAKVMGVYYEAYKWGATKITDVPSEFNVIFLFTASPDGPPVNGSYNNIGDGTFVFKEGYQRRHGYPSMMPSQGNPSVAPALVQQVRARGQKVLMTVGGAGQGFNFNTREKSQNFVNSFIAMNAYFLGEGGTPTPGRAFDGVDFNNFESGVGSSSAEMVWIAQQLKALYGPSFMITAPPSGATDYGWIDTNIGRALNAAGLLSFFSPQIYDDGPRYATAEKIAGEINRWISAAPSGYVAASSPANQFGLGDASKIVIGLPAPAYSPSGSGYPLSRATAAYDLVKARHPTLRGVFAWNFHEVQASNKGFESAFVPRVFNGASPTAQAPAPSPAPAPAPVPAPAPAPAPTPVASLPPRPSLPPVPPTPVAAPLPVQTSTPVAATTCATELWDGSRRYMPGDKVSRFGSSYVALPISATTWNVNSSPETTPTYWRFYPCASSASAPAPAPAPVAGAGQAPAPTGTSCTAQAWSNTRRYMPGETVYRRGLVYVAAPVSATIWNLNSPPEITRNYWDLVKC